MPGGSFVCKIFQGEDFNKFSDLVKAGFKKSRIFKPQSSRKASKEIYIIGLGFAQKSGYFEDFAIENRPKMA